MARYTLLDAFGQSYHSAVPGTFGGHRKARLYGRLDCPAALRAIKAGGYVTSRVFFADEQEVPKTTTGARTSIASRT